MTSTVRALLLFLALCLAPTGAQDPVVVNPKIARVEFENERVRVLRIHYRPQERLAMHLHPGRVVVRLTDARIRETKPNGDSGEEPGRTGECVWSDAVTHTTENLGDQPAVIIEIEIKKADAPSAVVAAPQRVILSATEEGPVPVQDEPYHRWQFENQYVRVIDVVLPPGKTMLFHTHAHDNVAIRLNEALVRRQDFGKEWQPDAKVVPGGINYAEGAKKPYTHRIKNIGTTTFRVLDIELLE